jgi:hypothetical protein
MSTSHWKLMVGLVAASSAIIGCVGTEAEFADRESNLIADDEPAQPAAALASALATPAEFGGYFANGVGAFLSAQNNSADLTLYVVTPASRTTFKHPSLQLMMPGDEPDELAEAQDFEDVTLEQGESRSFHAEPSGELQQVIANFAY